ncbi:uncharacterized protein B0I36DRAFT_333061 [Microdochium trichocladiopsis]|uniref:Uncharacterized protein n=1 Tax=Microdochium trichocladiopsis TaxID=1682393 RepID=A0A9P8XY57_9PEZI|nr:uncharacterized protein B0I36DRAFT_333061 [Microdochium trichocladiopsis]KAH7020708.1 hypothetical protein B0I36DRAFT_333061 [Microdochium trichocladiopsis]
MSTANKHALFVNYTAPEDARDGVLRTRIRRHVMEDIGRARRRRPPRPRVVALELRRETEYQNRVPRGLEPSTTSTGLHLGLEDWELIRFTITEAEYRYRPFRVVWNHIAMRDPAAINLTLAAASVYKRQTLGLPGHPGDFNIYYTRSLAHLNAKLGGSMAEQTSEGAIITVLGLACHDVGVRNWERWAYHANGLATIVRMRGGMDGLEDGAVAYATWVDVAANEVMGRRPQIPVPAQYLRPINDHIPTPRLQALLSGLDPATSLAMRRLSFLASTVNDRLAQSDNSEFWVNDCEASRLLVPSIHALQAIPEQSEWPGPLIRWAGQILVLGLKRRLDFNTGDGDLLRDRLVDALSLSSQQIWQEQAIHASWDLELWALLTTVSYLDNLSVDDATILTLRICQVMREGGLTAGLREALDICRDIAWVDEVVVPGRVEQLGDLILSYE